MITLHDLFPDALFAEMLEQRYVRRQTHPTLPLAILNYTESCAYDGAWNEVTRQCRGLIYELDTGRVVARPFPKFFNLGDPHAPELDLEEPAVVTDKLDGSFGILYPNLVGGAALYIERIEGFSIATRGSFTSEQAIHATALLHERYGEWSPNPYLTYVFEILFPANRIVCLEGSTALNRWNGEGTITIREIVDGKADPLLIGVDDDGRVVPTHVTARYNNGRREDWLAVTVSARTTLRSSATKHPNVLRMTSDHRVFADGDWRLASDLRPGQVLVSARFAPSASVIHLIRAALLGDGGVYPSPTASAAWFREGHSTKRDGGDYVSRLHRWLGQCATKLTGPEGFGVVQTRSYDALGQLRREWYSDGRKAIPSDLSWIDDFAVAKWYMDDGCLVTGARRRATARFATNCFSYEDVERLGILLNERYRVTCHVSKTPSGPALSVSAGLQSRGNNIDQLWRAIAPHIVPSMRYKLPPEHHDAPYVEYPVGTESLEPVDAVVQAVERLDASRATNSWSRTAYDIRTETGNFFAKNVLVHNCDYGDTDDLFLLAILDIDTGRPVPESDLRSVYNWPGPCAAEHPYRTLAEALAAEPRPNAEGFVVYLPDLNARVKLKQADYVALHRILTGTNARHVWEVAAVQACAVLIREPKHWGSFLGIGPARAEEVQALGDDWLADVPDEFYGWVHRVIDEATVKVWESVRAAKQLATVARRIPERRARYEHVVATMPDARLGDHALCRGDQRRQRAGGGVRDHFAGVA